MAGTVPFFIEIYCSLQVAGNAEKSERLWTVYAIRRRFDFISEGRDSSDLSRNLSVSG